MDGTYRKSKGNAGLEGVQFQLDLLTVCLLNALHHRKNWRISSENQQAGKYDDLVLELPDKSVFLQAKFKQTKKISRDQLFSNNSKNADFSLPKYFFSYLELKSEVKERTVIICTNTDINQKSLKDLLSFHQVSSDSMLHYEEATCSYFTFNKNVLPDLKANAEIYLDKNLQGKGIDKAVITDESMEDFLNNLQFFYNYPCGEELHKIIKKLLFRLKYLNLCSNLSYHEIYRKVEDWFKQPKGEYLTEYRTKAMLCEIRSDSYCQSLNDYNISFESNCFNFTCPHRIVHVKAMEGYLLQILKIFHATQSDKTKKLYVNPHDTVEIQRQIVEAFELHRYRLLIMVWTKIRNETIKAEISSKLRKILEKDQYKKIILISEDDNNLAEYNALEDIYEIDQPVTFIDLSKKSQEKLLTNKNVLFQGERVNLKELLGTQTTEDCIKQLHAGILEKLIRGEEIKIGRRLLNLDEDIACYYIPRIFEIEGSRISKKEDTVQEQSLFDVNQKVVLISDSAGMGKTTVLTKIAIHTKETNSFLWVIKINLQDYTGILKDFLRKKKDVIGVVELLNFQETTALRNKFEEYVFSINQKVVLLLDGVDEISPNYTGLILRLLSQCQGAANIAKIFLTTRPHMNRELIRVLNVDPFQMLPFTRENQIDFLTKYWIYNMRLVDINKRKCERYAQILTAKISSWTEPYYSEENPFGAIPLQVRMMAEIFQEKNISESMDWESCSEYLNGDREVPKLPENFNITELYGMLIEKKRDIFLDKGNPSGNTAADQALIDQFEECLAHHRNLALKVILPENQYNLFSNYCESNSSCVLKIGIVQKCDENLFFVHRTFAEYFVAESILQELQRDPSVEFQKFLIDEVLVRNEFKLIRVFFDRRLQTIVDSLSSDIFKKYQSHTCDSNLNLIFHLSGEGCVATLQLILKSINFKIIKNETCQIAYWKLTNLTKTQNTLNDLQIFVHKAGVNVRNEFGETPLQFAIKGNSLEMVKFLIEQGANVNLEFGTALNFAAQMGQTNIVAYFLKNNSNVYDEDDYGRTPLHLAAKNGKVDVVNYLVQLNVNVNVKDYEHRTPLHYAALNDQLTTMKHLVKHGANIKDIDDRGRTPLHLGAAHGGLAAVNYLLECGSDVNNKDNDGGTALHCAAETGGWDIIKRLLEFDININDRNDKGSTPLHIAVCHRGLNIVNYLVQHGANVNNKDNDGNTALHWASKEHRSDIVKYLVEHGANINSRNGKGRTPLHFAAHHTESELVNFLVENGSDIHIKDNDGNSVLHMAAEGNKFNTVKYLVKLGVNVNDRGERGCTPLQLVARYGHLNTVNYLVEHGSDINTKDNDACTSLHWAAEGGKLNIVEYFLTKGINVNDKDDKGRTPLHLAARCGKPNVVNYLVRCGSDINTKDNNGAMPLHWAAQGPKLHVDEGDFLEHVDFKHLHSNSRIFGHDMRAASSLKRSIWQITKLIDCFVTQANINDKDNEGRTPLHLGARYKGLVFVTHLVRCGSNVNIKDNEGRTALHWATEEGDSSTVDYLVRHGAHVNGRDNKGHTPLHLAAQCGKLEVVKCLMKYDLDVNIKDNDGITALQLASESDKLYIAKYLEKFVVGARSSKCDKCEIS